MQSIDIPPPSRAWHHNRDVECAFALQAAFVALASQAEAAGWMPGEVKTALVMLAWRRTQPQPSADANGVH